MVYERVVNNLVENTQIREGIYKSSLVSMAGFFTKSFLKTIKICR